MTIINHNQEMSSGEVPFNAELSLELDRATAAYEDALYQGDEVRARYAAEWKRRVERLIWGNQR